MWTPTYIKPIQTHEWKKKHQQTNIKRESDFWCNFIFQQLFTLLTPKRLFFFLAIVLLHNSLDIWLLTSSMAMIFAGEKSETKTIWWENLNVYQIQWWQSESRETDNNCIVVSIQINYTISNSCELWMCTVFFECIQATKHVLLQFCLFKLCADFDWLHKNFSWLSVLFCNLLDFDQCIQTQDENSLSLKVKQEFWRQINKKNLEFLLV